MTAALDPSANAPSAPPSAVRRVDLLLTHYGESHTNPTNELIHFCAIPLIMLSLLGLMYSLHPALAIVFAAASLVYYVRLSLVFLIAMTLISAGLLAILWQLDSLGILLQASVGVFVVAWIFQFIGHKIEGKKPSFFEDIQYLWVGPLFVLSRLFLKAGIRW